MRKAIGLYLLLSLTVGSLTVTMSGCKPNGGLSQDIVDIMSRPTELRFVANEIRDYQGVRLDPSIGPRDNSIRGIQQVDMSSYSLKISGEVDNILVFNYDNILELEPHQRLITLHCVEGWTATVLWQGVRIMELLNEAELTEKARVVIFHCHDGYTTSLPISTIRDRDMLLAYSSNGTTLPASLGYPFIVVAEDKLGYKWARWVIGMEVSSNADYLGFWENEGFPNDADIDP